MVFPVVRYGCESWTVKKAERWRTDAFELWCWRRLLRVPWTARRSNQSILKEISPGVLWKEWCWSWNSSTLATSCDELTHWKRLWCWEGLWQEEKGMTEDEMDGWNHWLDGHEFECTQGVSDDQKAWRAVIHGVTKSRTGLSEWTELNWAEHKIIENHIFVFQILFFLILSFCKNEKSANAIVK